jgi:hypothetical protein
MRARHRQRFSETALSSTELFCAHMSSSEQHGQERFVSDAKVETVPGDFHILYNERDAGNVQKANLVLWVLDERDEVLIETTGAFQAPRGRVVTFDIVLPKRRPARGVL